MKLKDADQARRSAKAGLKTVERQTEDQRQKLHLIEIDLATERQLVMDLKAKLRKTREAAQLAKEVAETEKKASYQLGMEETEIRLVEEHSEVCRHYCDATWDKALSAVGVPANSTLRQPGSIYYHPDICVAPDAIPFSTAIAPDTSEQPFAIQAALPPPEASKGSSQVGDQSQRAEGDKDKDKGKEAEAKTKEADPKAKDTPTSQLSQKEDPPAPKST